MRATAFALALIACVPSPATDDEIGESSDAASGESTSESTESGESTSTSESDESTGTSESTGDESTSGDETWRSALYPEDWQPGFADDQGRFLHDFSYAGYHAGEQAIPDAIAGVELSVIEFGADPSGASDSTAAIQATIDAVAQAGGGVVMIPAGSYRCDDLLAVTTSNLVIRGEGPDQTFLWFTREQDMTGRANLALRGQIVQGVEQPLSEDGQPLAGEVWVADAQGLNVGDSIGVGWVISDEFVAEHGMTGTWMAFNGQWRPFFRREIAAIECSVRGCMLSLDVPLRYPALLRDQASVRVETGYLREVGVEDLAVSTTIGWDAAWASDQAHAIALSGVADGWVRRVHSFMSSNDDGHERHLASGGILIEASKRVTVADSIMAKPQNRGDGGNGYLFEITRSNEILVRDCEAHEGRHNFIQNWDFGTSGCVWLRDRSEGGMAFNNSSEQGGQLGYSEFHHSLAMANLIDDCVVEDGWQGVNRIGFSSGAGHSATQNVFWHVQGGGMLRSFQYGWGYVIGSEGPTVVWHLEDGLILFASMGTEPEDWVEGVDMGATLEPSSLYVDQLGKRLGG
ncbi:glycosyl hydrolase family 28-related protein [Nannocystaceae bacterium ST9]